MKEPLTRALASGRGVIRRSAHPDLGRQIDYALRIGDLTRVLRGVYCRPADAALLETRARAVVTADPRAVITRAAAAVLHGWAEIDDPGCVSAASRRLHARPGFAFEQRGIPAELVRRVRGIPITSRALTALDLVDAHGAGILDAALRRRVPLAELWRALELTGPRRGDALRRKLLTDSRAEPWSEAEREAHRLLRTLPDLPPWRGNRPIHARDGELLAVCDIAFDALKLALEIDGDEFHAATRRHDLLRDRELAALGWHVVRFSAREVLQRPEAFLAAVARIVRARVRLLGRAV